MSFPLEVVKLMRDTREPLRLAVAPDGTDRNGRQRLRIEREGMGSAAYTAPSLRAAVTRLLEVLAMYPQEASVNGNRPSRTPFDGRCPVFLKRERPNRTNRAPEIDVLSHWHPPTVPFRYNILAGGVLCQSPQTSHLAGHIYYTPSGEPGGHWEFADAVTLSPLVIIDSGDMRSLTQEQYNNLLTGRWFPRTDYGHPKSVYDRAHNHVRRQIARTMADPELPPRHRGPLYSYVTGAPSRTYHYTQAIIVHSIPLEFSPDDNPANGALADALYRHGNGHVPVWHHRNSGPEERRLHTLDPDAAVEFRLENRTGTPPVTSADSITAHYVTLPDRETHSVEADFSAGGYAHSPEVCVSRKARDREDLPRTVAAGYAAESEYGDVFGPTQRETEERLSALTEQAQLGSRASFASELRTLADSFNPHSGAPDRSVSATSSDGSITVTYRPPSGEDSGSEQQHQPAGREIRE